MKESIIQQQCVHWFRKSFPDKVIFSIPNGAYLYNYKGFSLQAIRLVREGMLAGVPDLFIPSPSPDGRYHGMFIEMKSEKGKLSEKQKVVIDYLMKNGYRVVVCKDFEQFENEVNSYFDSNA